jgi:hypothetical protein
MLTVALVMAALMLAVAMPAFAQSFASETNKDDFLPGPNEGHNFGHCRSGAKSNVSGQDTAEASPSFRGGKDKESDVGVLCSRPSSEG